MKTLLRKPQRGFTLIELLIVVTIIVIVVTVAATSYTTVARNSRNAQRVTDLQKIANALEEWYGDHGFYPSTSHVSNSDGTWEAAGRTPNDHTRCLLGGTHNTNFVPTGGFHHSCSYPTFGPDSNLPANVYIANGDPDQFPRDPIRHQIPGVDLSLYAYVSNGQSFAIATRYYEGLAPERNRLVPGSKFYSNGSPWDAELKNCTSGVGAPCNYVIYSPR